jgi:hypothetical protein
VLAFGIVACSSSHDAPPAAHDAARGAHVADAALADAASPDAAVDATAISITPASSRDPSSLCEIPVRGMLGMIRIRADKATGRGHLDAFNASTAPSRELNLIARTAGPEITFVFDGYGERDSTFKGRPVPRSDKLRRGVDIVARIVATGVERRLYFDGAFHLAEGFDPPHDGGYYVCE